MKQRKCPIHGTYSTGLTCDVIVVDKHGQRRRCGALAIEVYGYVLTAMFVAIAILITQLNAPLSFIRGAQPTITAEYYQYLPLVVHGKPTPTPAPPIPR